MNPSAKLTDLVDSVCKSRNVKSEAGRSNYVYAIRSFDELLDKTATLADLSIEAFKPLKSRHQRHLILIWAEAYRRGYVATRPADSDLKGFEFFRLMKAPPGGGMKLADFTNSEWSSLATERFLLAIKRFSLALDRPATIGDLNTETIEAFVLKVCQANPNVQTGVRDRGVLRMAWWAVHRAGLAPSPGDRLTPWDCLPELMKKAPPIVMDRLPEESKTLLLSEFLDRHYYTTRPGLSPKTRKEYGTSVRKLERYLDRPAVLADLNNQTIGTYFAALAGAVSQSKGTVIKERAQLIAFWRHAHTVGMLVVGPLIQPIRAPDKIPTALTLDQLKLLRKTIPSLSGKLAGVEWSLLVAACFSIQYATGARLGEVIALRFDDIQNGVVTFRAETRKFGKEPIVKRLPAWMLDDIEALRSPKRSLVFTSECSVERFAYQFKKLFNLAGVPRPKGKSSHLLRSTHATMLWLAGHDATASLGHSSEATTMKAYLDRRFKPDESFSFLPDLGGDTNGK